MNTRDEVLPSTDAIQRRRIEPLSVEVTSDAMIRLQQDDYGEGGGTILLSPDQIDMVVKFLQEAKQHAIESRTGEM